MSEKETPWRRVFAKFGLSQAELARLMDVHRSKVCVALTDEDGLISPRDQEKLMRLAKDRKIDLAPGDLLPVIE